MIGRRTTLGFLVGSAAVYARGVWAQSARVRRISLIVATAESDPDAQDRAAAIRDGLRELGWIEGRNLAIDYRWGGGDSERVAKIVEEVVASSPDVIVSNGTPALSALQRKTRTIPIVFVVVTNPVGAGFVESLARPGANITGFSTYEPEIGGKWFEVLHEFAPTIRRVGVVSDPKFGGFAAVAGTLQIGAARSAVEVVHIGFDSSEGDIEAQLATFSASGGGGLVVMPTALNLLARDRLIAAAARYRIPAVYPFRPFAQSGGLMSYGFEPLDLFRRSAAYVDRILKGESPGELPVQAPARFQLVLNAKTAKALNADFPAMLLARADEVIE